MRIAERIGLYVVAGVALVAGLNGGLPERAAEARQDDSHRANAERPIAVCDLVGVVQQLMETERYRPAREELQAATEESVRPIRERMQALEARGRELEEKARNLDPNDPSYGEAAQEYQQVINEHRGLQAQFQEAAQKAARELDGLSTRQLLEAWDIARTSADAVAEGLGYDYVLCTRPPDEEIQDAPDVSAMVRAMLSRPVIRYPKEANITEDVKQDLKLD